MILSLFGSVLIGSDRLVFRDVSHFYTPLYEYLAYRASEDWLPLWNPLDQTGMPLIGETTTACLYPPRWLLFAMPIASETAMGWYVAVHLILASLAVAWVARRGGRSQRAAILAGLVYPLSGSVCFLYCNPPFLVGAAWLPLVLGPLICSPCRQGLGFAVLVPAVGLAMMVLGGDPQTALHAGIAAFAVGGYRAVRDRDGERFGDWKPLLLAPLIAAVLSAPQLAASVDWGLGSQRFGARGATEWWQSPQPGSHQAEAFEFSVPPWHLLELATPNAFGSPFPEYRRLSSLIPGDGRVWTPTLYMGILPLLAVTCRLLRIRRDGVDCWLGLAAGSLLCAFGAFGVVWLWQTITGTLGQVDGAVGGPYWVLHHGLPGYAVFRYPAKWLPLFALGVALVTARWFDELKGTTATLARRTAFVWLTVLACLLVVGLWFCAFPDAWQRLVVGQGNALPFDRLWGPLQIEGGLYDIVRSLAHSVLVLSLVVVALPRRTAEADTTELSSDSKPGTSARSRFEFRQWCARNRVFTGYGLLVVITAIDLWASTSALVAHVPRWLEQELLAEMVDPNVPPATRWLRTQSGGGWPRAWRDAPSDTRLPDVEASQRGAWFGRWHLVERRGVFNNMSTLRPREIDRFWEATHALLLGLEEVEQRQSWRSIQAWLAIDGISQTSGQTHIVRREVSEHQLAQIDRRAEPISNQGIRLMENWEVLWDEKRGPDVWRELLQDVARHGQATTPRLISQSRVNGDSRLNGDPGPNGKTGQTWQPEPDRPILEQPLPRFRKGDLTASIRLLRNEPERVEIAVRSIRGGLLRRPVYQDGWWRAELRSGDGEHRSVPVYRVDFIMQGILVPPGDWTIHLQYRPVWLLPSLIISAIGWSMLVARGLVIARSPRGARHAG